MPQRDEIVKELSEILRRELDWDDELPSGELARHFDSLQLMTLLVAIEDHFRIAVDPSEEERVETTGELIALIEEKTDDGKNS